MLSIIWITQFLQIGHQDTFSFLQGKEKETSLLHDSSSESLHLWAAKMFGYIPIWHKYLYKYGNR